MFVQMLADDLQVFRIGTPHQVKGIAQKWDRANRGINTDIRTHT